MSAIEKRVVAGTKQAISIIGKVAEVGLGVVGSDPRVGGPLRAILAITTAVQAAMAREIDPAEMLAAIGAAVEDMDKVAADLDSRIDAGADAKYGKPSETSGAGESVPTAAAVIDLRTPPEPTE